MAQRKTKKKKSSNTGIIFWLIFAIIIVICFFVAKGKIANVLKETNFFNEVVGTEPTVITELVNTHADEQTTDSKNDPIIQLQLPEEVEQDEADLIERSEAIKQAEILQAEGQAESIMKVKQAEAEGIRLIREAKADSSVLTLKAYEALTEVSKGQATKIIIPSEIQGMAGLVSSIKAVAEEEKK